MENLQGKGGRGGLFAPVILNRVRPGFKTDNACFAFCPILRMTVANKIRQNDFDNIFLHISTEKFV